MAKQNTKLAVLVLIAIVILSLLLYKNFSMTGNYARPTPEVCAKYTYPTECSMASCSWSAQEGCTSSYAGTSTASTQPCSATSWWQCFKTKGCQWANGQCRVRKF